MTPALTAYKTQPWPKGVYKRYRAQRACHRNASSLVQDHPNDLKLVKGYALTAYGWVGHWWAVDKKGRVVDPSWKNDGIAYVGVEEVDLHAYIGRILDSGHWELEVETLAPTALIDALEQTATVTA